MNIAVFLAESPWGSIDELAIYKGLGGRETALVCLALEWGKLGHHVYAFVPRENFDIIEHEESGGTVRWIPNKFTVEVTEAVQPDLFISWENVQVLKELGSFNGTTAIEMQVAHLDSDVPVGQVADYVCVLSEWAGDFFKTKHKIRDEQVIVFPNGVNMARFDDDVLSRTEMEEEGVGEYNFIYSSSPDRGLHHLLRMWPWIQGSVMSAYGAESQLHVCYGIENFVEHNRWAHREDALRALDIEELISQQGVVYHGKVGQDVLAGLMLSCDLMLYPADTMSPTETGCLVAGTPIDCPRDFALYPDGVPIEEIEVGQLVWTINEETKVFELKRVERAWKTRVDAPVWRVTLDSGEVIEGTEEHPFMRRDGTWVEMASLQSGDSLMPLYRDFEPRVRTNPNGPNGGVWKDEYKEVGDVLWPGAFGGRDMVVHHEDERHANSSEENLSLLTRNEHRAAHDMRGGWTKVNDEMSPEERAKRIARTTALAGKRWATVPVAERRLYWHKTHPKYRCVKACDVCEQLYGHIVETIKITSETPGLTMEQRRSYLRWEREKIRREDEKAAGNPFMDDDAKSEFFNHKVVSVEFTETVADVYNLEVEGNHNYIVHGVVVHNCISIVEALAAGCPVVTTNCDCIPSEFGEVAVIEPLPLVSNVDYGRYIGSVRDALDPEDYEALVEAGKKFAAKRDWAKIAQQWIDFFERR